MGGRKFNTQKSFKEKLRELKDVATGKKTIYVLAHSTRPPRLCSIYQARSGLYKIDGLELNEVEYQEWYKQQDFRSGDKVIIFKFQPGNDPLQEETSYFDNGIVWKETKHYRP